MVVARSNTIQILYSTGNVVPGTALTGADAIQKGELVWVDHNGSAGGGGENGRLYIGDGTTAAAEPRWIGGIGTGVAAAPAGTLTGTELKDTVVTSSLTEVGAIGTGSWAATDVAVLHGGTGASTASDARTNLGLAIGTNVQAQDADLAAIAGLTSAANKGIQFTGSGTAAVYDLTAAGKALLDDADAGAQRTTLGLGTAATRADSYFATGAEGDLATNALPKAGGTVTGDLVVQGDLTLTGDQTELSTTVIAVTDKEMYLSVPGGLKKGSWTQAGSNAVIVTLESAHGLTASTAYDLLITGSSDASSIPDGVYECTMHASTTTVFTFDSPITATVSSGATLYAAQAASTDATATGAGIFVPKDIASGEASVESISYEGEAAGWTSTGNWTFTDGAYDVNIPSHDDGTNGLSLGGTLITTSAAEINNLDGLTLSGSNTGDQTLPTLVSLGAVIGTNVQAWDAQLDTLAGASAANATAVTNLSGTNSGDQTLTGLTQYIASDGADTMSASSAALTISDIVGTGSGSTGGKLVLQMNDGALLADNDRLGVIEFKGAEDGSATFSTGARIEAIARDAWGASANDADLVFYTTDGTTQSAALTLDADNTATFTGEVIGDGFTGTLDGVLGGGTAAGATVTTLVSTGVTTIGDNSATVAINSSDWDISTTGVITDAVLAGGTF